MSLKKLFSISLAAFIVIFVMIMGATANAAVYPQGSFNYSGFGGYYEGTCTTIIDTSGITHSSCRGSLVAGSPVSQLTDISSGNMHGVVTPGGQVVEIVN